MLCSELPPHVALARWLEDWNLLRWPTFIPQQTWSAYALELFRSAVFALIEAEPLAGWDEIHEQVATYMAHQQSASIALARKNLRAVSLGTGLTGQIYRINRANIRVCYTQQRRAVRPVLFL